MGVFQAEEAPLGQAGFDHLQVLQNRQGRRRLQGADEAPFRQGQAL
jgi:hypothetical protein